MTNKDKGLNQRVTFMTDKSQRDWLAQQSAVSGAPLGEIIRRAIAVAQQVQKSGRK